MAIEEARLLAFGSELRRLRTEAGLSLREFAQLVHYSKSHLSKIENGLKQASPDLARRCDAHLNAGGDLATLVQVVPVPVPTGTDGAQGQPAGGYDGGEETEAAVQHDVPDLTWPPEGDPTRTFRVLFTELCGLGQSIGPGQMIPLLRAHAETLEVLARRSAGNTRNELLVLAARYAEFAGWMFQEAGDDVRAERWTDRAVAMAVEAGDQEMAAYAFVRKALIALYRHDAIATIDSARQAQVMTTDPRILGLAAQREAQGHAIAGDELECRRLLDQAREHMQRHDAGSSTQPVYGSSHVADIITMSTGWCLHDVGRSDEAASVLQAELDRVPDRAERAHARFGVRLALAHAASRELDQAIAVAEPLLAVVPRLDSATIRIDLRRFAHTLNRWHGDPAVRQIMPSLTRALHERRVA